MTTHTYILGFLLICLISCINKPIPKRFEGKYKASYNYYSYNWGLLPECCVPNATCNCLDTVLLIKDTFEVEIKEQKYEDAEDIISIGGCDFIFSDANKGEYHYNLFLYHYHTQDPHIKSGEAYIKDKHFRYILLSKLGEFWDSTVCEGDMIRK